MCTSDYVHLCVEGQKSMTEKEMEDLLWDYCDEFFEQALVKFKRQPSSVVGRADLVFQTSTGGLLVVEIKRGRLPRQAVDQLLDYFGMMKRSYPNRSVDLMLIANVVPAERRHVCERLGIKWHEIPEDRFRRVARDCGYDFVSEKDQGVPVSVRPAVRGNRTANATRTVGVDPRRSEDADFGSIPETAWHGLANTYREAVTRSTEASDNYHLAGFLLAAGAGLGRSVFVEGLHGVRLYPNFYLFIVGRSTWSRKDTAIDRAERLINEASPDVEFHHSLPTSRKGLLRDVAGTPDGDGASAPSVVVREGYYVMRHLLFHKRGPQPTQVGQLLHSLFDSPERVDLNVLRRAEMPETPSCLSLVANADARPWLQGQDDERLERRLARCFMFVPGDRKPPMAVPDLPSEMHWNYVVLKLRKAFDFWRAKGRTPMRLSEHALNLHDDFCASLQVDTKDDLRSDLSKRYAEHMLRVAMVYASLDQSDSVEEAHARAAVELCEYLICSLRKIFRKEQPDSHGGRGRARRRIMR